MKSKSRKISGWIFFSVIAFILLSAAIFVVLDCAEEDDIGKYSPYCYLCITANVRNFPLIKEKVAPRYFVDLQLFEPNDTHPGYYGVSYESGAAPAEIIEAAEIYFGSRGFKVVNKENFTLEEDDGERMTIDFDGQRSTISVLARPSDSPNGGDKRNVVSVNETLKDEEKQK